MQAKVGDKLLVHGRKVGDAEQHSTIIEVRGSDGSPPYRVRHADGSEALVFPGPDCVVVHAEEQPRDA